LITLPCFIFQKTFSILNFLYFIFPQTMLTAISMSAIATNGVVPGNEAFYLKR